MRIETTGAKGMKTKRWQRNTNRKWNAQVKAKE